MTRRTWGASVLIAAALSCAPTVARADSLFGIHGGGFFPDREENRNRRDVILNNLLVEDPFVYDVSDFDGGAIGGEYLLGLGDWFEAGIGATFYQRTVNTYYGDSVHPDGSNILTDLRLRIVPVTASFRYFPIGRTVPVQPYIGGGVNFYRWEYKEEGEFVDYRVSRPPRPTFFDTFKDDGTAVGPIFLAGVRAPIGGDRFMIGGEFRWQGGTADLDPALQFTGDKLDLGGIGFVGTFHVRF
jgi:hypothetical protein